MSFAAMRALRELPQIIEIAERLIPTPKRGQERKLTVVSEMARFEGPLALDAGVIAAKSAVIDAQVAYLKAMDTAEARARLLGVPLIGLPRSTYTEPAGLPQNLHAGDASRKDELAALGSGPS